MRAGAAAERHHQPHAKRSPPAMSGATSCPCPCRWPRLHVAAVVVAFALAAAVLVGGAEGKQQPSAAQHNYEDALEKSLLYFEAQRSGRLPHSQRVAWRHHSGLTDGLEQGVDLVGGYYDAGDHVKFGLPMAFTVTMLSWSLIEYGDDVAAAGELGHALEAVKWGTDYFIKAHTKPDELWAEVGDGDTDHYCWQRPEDMTTSRQAYKVDRDHPGSDVAGETAAAMAAASIVFRASNPHYSHLLLHHAQQLLLRGEHEERHRSTLEQYKAKAEHYVCACLGRNAEGGADANVERSPGGMLYIRQWNNMQYVTSAAFLLSAYSDYLSDAGVAAVSCAGGETVAAAEVFALARAQVDYVLGTNPRGVSYLVGYGPKYPNRVHHRAASIVPYKHSKEFIGCTQGFDHWFGRRSSNPNVLVGAIVGGPDRRDRFRDNRENYMQTEACTYNTAPMVGMFAKLHRMARLEREQGSTTPVTSTAADV
nr:unnamed protein product [Digitaria exilis]